MSDEPLPQPQIILYQTENGRTRIQCRFENETLWLTRAQMAELFETTPQNVTLHLRSIFAEGELVEEPTCKDCLQVRFEGGRPTWVSSSKSSKNCRPQQDPPRNFNPSAEIAQTEVWLEQNQGRSQHFMPVPQNPA
jgi:hypothetical protein